MSTKVCGNCGIKHASTELSGPQHLCKECRRTLAQEKCSFCQIDFYVTPDTNKTKTACKKCSEYFNKFGNPKNCDWCRSPSAFKGSKCFQCKSAEEKYGKPSRCEGCKNTAYFDKGLEAKRKVNNKALCLLCTLKYKKELHRSGKFKRSSMEIVNNRPSKSRKTKENTDSSSSKHSKTKVPVFVESATQVNLCGHGNSENQDRADLDKDNSMEAILITTQLKEEIAGLKRQLDTRDRTIIDKGKEYTELKTECWEVEKKLKKKLQDQQLDHENRIQKMEAIVRDLKSQNIKLTKLTKTGGRKSTPPVSGALLLMDTEAADSS